jgi:hypothetical protein
MAFETTVLSLNPDRQALRGIETALRENGFEVISVDAPLYARFEIEMGRCGVFMTCYMTPAGIYRDLAGLFRLQCPHSTIIFLAQTAGDTSSEADIVISEHDDPNSVVETIRGSISQTRTR